MGKTQGGDIYFRIAIGTRPRNEELLLAFQKCARPIKPRARIIQRPRESAPAVSRGPTLMDECKGKRDNEERQPARENQPREGRLDALGGDEVQRLRRFGAPKVTGN